MIRKFKQSYLSTNVCRLLNETKEKKKNYSENSTMALLDHSIRTSDLQSGPKLLLHKIFFFISDLCDENNNVHTGPLDA